MPPAAPDDESGTGEPAELPVVIDFDRQPNPITANGLIGIVVTADHAEGVRMETGLGEVVELTFKAGKFVGDFPVLTGLPCNFEIVSSSSGLTPPLRGPHGPCPRPVTSPTPAMMTASPRQTCASTTRRGKTDSPLWPLSGGEALSAALRAA